MVCEIGVSFKAWLERDPNKMIPGAEAQWTLELFWERSFYPSIEMVLNDLHSKGLIEAGDYIMNIDW